MKRRTLLAIVAVLALVTLACSLTGGAGEEVPEATQPPEATVPPVQEEENATTGSTWAGIPIYPGANSIGETVDFPEEYKTNYEIAEGQSYETDAGVKEVASFYLAQMPKNGWEKIMHIPMGENSYMSVWNKGGGEMGTTIMITESDGKTHIGIIRAEGPK
jgi:predicted small secreted protein